jgi:GNAT superfamily N-acetyltransferase
MQSPSTIDIRLSREDELPALLDMRRAMTLELDSQNLDANPTWRTRFARFVNELAATDDIAFFVAEHDGQLVGMGGVYKLRNHRSVIYGAASAYVTSIYVRPEYRRKGLASRITESAVQWARDHRCVVIRLRASTGGRHVYETLGFKSTDEMELKLDH